MHHCRTQTKRAQVLGHRRAGSKKTSKPLVQQTATRALDSAVMRVSAKVPCMYGPLVPLRASLTCWLRSTSSDGRVYKAALQNTHAYTTCTHADTSPQPWVSVCCQCGCKYCKVAADTHPSLLVRLMHRASTPSAGIWKAVSHVCEIMEQIIANLFWGKYCDGRSGYYYERESEREYSTYNHMNTYIYYSAVYANTSIYIYIQYSIYCLCMLQYIL